MIQPPWYKGPNRYFDGVGKKGLIAIIITV